MVIETPWEDGLSVDVNHSKKLLCIFIVWNITTRRCGKGVRTNQLQWPGPHIDAEASDHHEYRHAGAIAIEQNQRT
jgi:hypothetical protein